MSKSVEAMDLRSKLKGFEKQGYFELPQLGNGGLALRFQQSLNVKSVSADVVQADLLADPALK